MKPKYNLFISMFSLIVGIGAILISWMILMNRAVPIDLVGAIVFYGLPIYILFTLPLYYGLKVLRLFGQLQLGYFFAGGILVAVIQTLLILFVLGAPLFDQKILSIFFTPLLLGSLTFVLFTIRFTK
ncbi:hypothetical protein QUF56_11915 [Ureibacillus composti]|nr:hypothetical protein [Ureibacillus composti]